jgi:hypothetical protein
MILSEQCQNGRCDDCPKILANGERCEHGCKGHINTAPVNLNESLKKQKADQDKIETITPNPPHIA